MSYNPYARQQQLRLLEQELKQVVSLLGIPCDHVDYMALMEKKVVLEKDIIQNQEHWYTDMVRHLSEEENHFKA